MRLINTFNLSTKAAVKLIKQIAFAERSCLRFPEAGKGTVSYCHFKELIFQKIQLDLGMIRKSSRENTWGRWLYIPRIETGMEKPGSSIGFLPLNRCEIKGYTYIV